MAFSYDRNGHPTITLKPQTIRKLLESIRAGLLDMAYFPDLYHPRKDQELSSFGVTDVEIQQANAIYRKIKFGTGGQLPLGRELKIRLLKAIRARQINLLSDFPELAGAYQAVQQDWSAITAEEKAILLGFCRKLN